MKSNEIIKEIEKLKHFRFLECGECFYETKYHILQMYVDCLNCSKQYKVRAFGAIGTEVQDIIDSVLLWAGEGEAFEAVMKRREEILKDFN